MAHMMKYHERIGKRVKELREECGRSILELAAKCRISENSLKSIESGNRDIKIDELFAISKALDIRISSIVNPCDYKLYERRKEEKIDRYISLERLSQILNIASTSIKKLCKYDEIPYLLVSGKYFFKASEVNEWLIHHCRTKKKIKEDQIRKFKIFGIEPLISAKEAGEILSCSRDFIYGLCQTIPYFRIGGRIRYKLTDIEDYRDKRKVDLWEITTNIGKWKSSFAWPEPSKEEKMVKEASWEQKYKENARPGYIVKEYNLSSFSFEELKQDMQKYVDTQILVKNNLLGCSYYIIQRNRHYGCRLKWWSLPEGRENYKVHSTGLKSDSPDKLRAKVDRLKKKIPKEDLIEIDYYSWRYSFNINEHNARITYYLLKRNNEKSAE